MIAAVYEWIIELPIIIPVGLILIGVLLIILEGLKLIGVHSLTRGLFLAERIKLPLRASSLVTVGLIIGIVAGIVGIIVGVIQIGVYFAWWPERLT